MKKRNSNKVSYVVALLAVVLVLGGAVYAYSVSQNINVAGNYNYYEAEIPAGEQPEVNFGAQPGTYVVVDQLEYGDGLSARLNFTAGATSTPGGLFSILNGTRQNMVCKDVVLNLHTADTAGGPNGVGARLGFAVGTSTNASGTWGKNAKNASIIATSTLATGTPGFLSYVANPGGAATWNGTIRASTTPFYWKAGWYIVGKADVMSRQGVVLTSASSTAVTANAGRVYLDCFVENK